MVENRRQIKFSNLLRNDEEQLFNQMHLNASCSFQANTFMMERLRRNSIQPLTQSFKERQASFSPSKHDANIKEVMNRTKIHRVLIKSEFVDRNPESIKGKRKLVHGKKKNCSIPENSFSPVRKIDFSIKKRVHTEEIQPKRDEEKTVFRIKKKPIFGLEDINISIQNCLKRKGGSAGLFLSTSSNTFYGGSSFYNSKRKGEASKGISPSERIKLLKQKAQKNEMEPDIITLFPQAVNKQAQRNRKKDINKFYTTNMASFTFSRSKTDDFDLNRLCGWEEEEEQGGVLEHNFF